MKIGYITTRPADDVTVWSGTTKFIYDNLKANYKVENIIISNNFYEKLLLLILTKYFKFKYSSLKKFIEQSY